jgi:hypothetical protein
MTVRVESKDQMASTGPRVCRLVADAEGGTFYLSTSELLPASGGINMGLTFQLGLEGSCIVAGTLEDPRLACVKDPEIQAIIPWDTDYVGALVNGKLMRDKTADDDFAIVTAIRLEISGPARITIASL